MDELCKTYYLAAVIDIMMAPIMEEIIFRFKSFEYFGEFMSKWVGIIVNGILFMVIHSKLFLCASVSTGVISVSFKLIRLHIFAVNRLSNVCLTN
ncbi:type II CAAX prenyl endopeptidase Rce1 family protein [Leuconostoc carnosum]|uniref:CPBP family glutamic-type intramembrane protease n=1 Tax=Leuconostoc carnosum TaxID=1252 RepID=UPI003BF518FF